MKILFCMSLTVLLFACNDTAPAKIENQLLNTELENAKEWLLAKVEGDPKSTFPTYDKVVSIDDEFGAAIKHCESQNDVTSMKPDLDACMTALTSSGWYDAGFQESLISELKDVTDNLAGFSMLELKERLLFMQLSYWRNAAHICDRNVFPVDTVGTFAVNRVGHYGEPFSTPIAAIAYYTAENYSVIVGDSLSSDRQLFGNVRELKYNKEHMPLYVDSTATIGEHRVPAQLLAMTISGKMDTMNFVIEYTIK